MSRPRAQATVRPSNVRPLRAGDTTLRYEQAIPRELVHRRALAEVLIADTVQVGPDEFLLATQLPRAHSLWSDRRNLHHDPLISIEIARQAGLALPHLYYKVPLGWQFISRTINMRVVDLAAFADDQSSPPQGELRTHFTRKWERDGELRGMAMEAELSIGGMPAASLHGDLAFFPREEYEQLREHVRARKPLGSERLRIVPHPVDPARVGRRLEANVAIEERIAAGLAPDESRFRAIIDQRHPCHFDHPQDHIPGAMLMEIYRQAAVATATRDDPQAASGAVLTGCSVELSDFAELDSPVECSAVVIERAEDGRTQLGLQLHQLDTQIGAARVELSFAGPREQL
jgi:hypothetical protein